MKLDPKKVKPSEEFSNHAVQGFATEECPKTPNESSSATEARTTKNVNMQTDSQTQTAQPGSLHPAGSERRPKVKGWWEEYRCGCVSETTARKKDLLGYCGKHGENRRQVFPELETMKAPNDQALPQGGAKKGNDERPHERWRA